MIHDHYYHLWVKKKYITNKSLRIPAFLNQQNNNFNNALSIINLYSKIEH